MYSKIQRDHGYLAMYVCQYLKMNIKKLRSAFKARTELTYIKKEYNFLALKARIVILLKIFVY